MANMLACAEAVAPEGSVLSLTAEPPELAAGGDSATVRAVVTLQSGDLVPYGALVTFVSSAGGLCSEKVASAPCSKGVMELPPALKVATEGGVAKVTFKSGAKEGSVSIVAQSGSAKDSVTIQIRALAPAGS